MGAKSGAFARRVAAQDGRARSTSAVTTAQIAKIPKTEIPKAAGEGRSDGIERDVGYRRRM
jgi:hypothetical protein